MELLRSATIHLQCRIHWAFAPFGYGLVRFREPARAAGLGTAQSVHRSRKLLLTPTEAVQLHEAARSTRRLVGDVAEVGAFMGASARILTEALPEKTVHVCDTFAGLPQDEDFMHAGDFTSQFDDVRRYLDGRKATLYRGLFPRETGVEIKNHSFCFVHLDVDLYSSTLESLQFFWPRLTPGGLLISHDHPLISGVVQAFREFFLDKANPVIQLSGNQVMVVKG